MSSPRSPFSRPEFSPLSIARMVWKRKIGLVLIWVIVAAVTWGVVSRIPPLYRAEALIMVDGQKIPNSYVTSTVNTDVQDRLATLTQEILSSNRLQKLVEDSDLYPNDPKAKFQEEKLAMLRNNITVRLEKGWSGDRPGAFRVAYQGSDRVKVAEVSNRIASMFIEENLKTREMHATGTSEFINSQLQQAKQRLDELEAAVSGYKVAHNGELPQQENTLLGAMGRLQAQFEGNRDAMNRGDQNLILLENTLSALEATASARAQMQLARAQMTPSTAVTRETPVRESVRHFSPKPSAAMRRQLDELRLRYSDEHPEVQRLKWMLARAEKEEAEEIAEQITEPGVVESTKLKPTEAVGGAPRGAMDPETMQMRERIASLRSQIGLAKTEIQKRKQDQDRILQGLSSYQNRIDRLPIREQEMAKITRDYEISKANYTSLLDKKLAADMASDMERRQKSERFTLVDPAKVPSQPYKPNRELLIGSGCLLGLVLGLVFALGVELRKDMFLGEWELPAGVVVLGTLPSIHISSSSTKHEGFWRRFSNPKVYAAKSMLLTVVAVMHVFLVLGSL